MKIRIAKYQDLEAIVNIYNQAIASGLKTADITPFTVEERKDWFQRHNPEKYPILVAEKDGMIIGYATISAYRPGREALRYTAEVSFYIDFNHHRKGIASGLMQTAIDMCPKLQIKTLFAILIETNIGSIKLLEKFGFERWGHLPKVAEFDGTEVGQFYYGLKIEG